MNKDTFGFDGPQEKKTEQLCVRLTPTDKARIEAVAAHEMRKPADFVRLAVLKALEEIENPDRR